MSNLAVKCAENLDKIRQNKPLIHNITNYVVMNYTANVLLAAGASPVMAHAESEVEEMVGFAGALVINIGTLSDSWISSMLTAGRKASKLGTPIVLDPVGSGATRLRTETAKTIAAETNVTIIRGNASEILSLHNEQSKSKGVDSQHSVDEAEGSAMVLAKELGATLAITGRVDFITDGTRILRVENGHSMMPMVTGTGCSATAIIGAFASVDPDPLVAAATGLAFFGLAGELAGQTARGPGSFMTAILDALYQISPDDIVAGCKIGKG
jgi:hydroxyethylthiazole kinase